MIVSEIAPGIMSHEKKYCQLKIIKCLVPAFFLLIICVNCYLTLAKHRPLDKFACLMLFLLVLAWLGKRSIFWITGAVICCYGIYSLLFISPKAAEATSMEFTSSLNYLIFGSKTGASMHQLIRLIPLFFYPSFFVFCIIQIRKRVILRKSYIRPQ